MKYFIILLFLTFAAVAADVPIISFPQKVDIVHTARKNPMILDLKIEQDNAKVMLDAIVDRRTDRDMAKIVARDLVLLVKSMSLDDRPRQKAEPGKGLYDYTVTIRRTDAAILVIGRKPPKRVDLRFDPPALENIQMRPVTRADGTTQ